MSREDLRFKYLSNVDAERLYREFPHVKPSPSDFCPTCSKRGKYLFKGEERECDCELQLQLFKHYATAGIGQMYQRLSWDDYQGSESVRELCEIYLAQHESLISQGIGIVLAGSYGTGKTMSLTLLMKQLMWEGYSCFSTTYINLIDMLTSSWGSKEERSFYEEKVKNSQVLLIDDLGKENKTRTGFTEHVFDRVLRERVQKGRVTFITTNLSTQAFGEEYGDAAESLISECSLVETVSGEDFRPIVAGQRMEEIKRGETRPIV